MKKLEELLSKLEYTVVQGSLAIAVNSVVYDSRKIEKNSLFICIEGAKFDGHTKVSEACEKGASVLVVSKEVDVSSDITVIKVDNTRKALAFISAEWFDNPAQKLITIGITGTKGKTTTTYIVKSILEKIGMKVGLVGTIEIDTLGRVIPAVNTTPESYLLQEYFREMVDNGVQAVVMEVSSQGLMMHRTDGFIFDYGIFTNLSPDHIGKNEHSSFEEYRSCKALLFKQCKTGIVNGDDDNTNEILKGCTCNVVKYGFNKDNDIVAGDIKLVSNSDKLGVSFKVSGLKNLDAYISMPGRFSVYNALTAISICSFFDVNNEEITNSLENINVRGRAEIIKIGDDKFFVIDYAHNAMSLESILTTFREYNPGRIITIFGCGGNRSVDRRSSMGKISGSLSDLTVITSDNPRDEEPLNIMKDIEGGVKEANGQYIMIEDRREAVRYMVKNCKKGDVCILAGKGHEDYQEIKGVKHHMDDHETIEEALKEFYSK